MSFPSQTISAWSAKTEASAAAQELIAAIGEGSPTAIVFFAPPDMDIAALSGILWKRYGGVVAGCTTAGELSDKVVNERGVTALALGADKVSRAAGAMVELSGDVGDAVRASVQKMGDALEIDVRRADGSRYAGIVLTDGLSGAEEEVNHALGTAAPGVLFVGGSAGDDLRFVQTIVALNGTASRRGSVLLLLEMNVPFAAIKTSSSEPTGHTVRVTRADESKRTVYEVDGKPVVPFYAAVAGVDPSQLGFEHFMRFPWGLEEGDDTWLRSPKGVSADGGLEFLCAIREGMTLTIRRQAPILAETQAAFEKAAQRCDGRVGAALLFNCVYRRIELDQSGLHREYQNLFKSFPAAGFHTYGESLIAHINQTCTALFLG